MEQQICSTDLRQKLTDVLQSLRDEDVTFVIETFGRPQAALINLDAYRRFQRFQEERESFFRWLEETAVAKIPRNADLSETEVIALIEQVRNKADKDN